LAGRNIVHAHNITRLYITSYQYFVIGQKNNKHKLKLFLIGRKRSDDNNWMFLILSKQNIINKVRNF